MSGELTGDLISNWINFKLYPESVEDTFFSPDILLSCIPSGHLCIGPKEVRDFLRYFFNQNGPDARVEIVASKMDIQENLLIEDINVIVTPLRSTIPWLFSTDITADLSAQKFSYGLKMTLQFYEDALVKVKLDWDQKVLENQIKIQEPVVTSVPKLQNDIVSEQLKEPNLVIKQLKESTIHPSLEPSSVVSTNASIYESSALIDEDLLNVDQTLLNDDENVQTESQIEIQDDLISDNGIIKSASVNNNVIPEKNYLESEVLEKSDISELDSLSVDVIPEENIVLELKDSFENEVSEKNNATESTIFSTDVIVKEESSEESNIAILLVEQHVPVVTSAVENSLFGQTNSLISKDSLIEKVSSPDVEQAEVNTLVDSEGSIHEPSTRESPVSQSSLPESKPISKPKEVLSHSPSKVKNLKPIVKKPTSTAVPISKPQTALNKDAQSPQKPLARSKSYHRSVTTTPMTKSQSTPNKDDQPPQRPLARSLSYHRSVTASPFSASRRPMSQNSSNPTESKSKFDSRTLLPIPPPLSRNRKFDARRLDSQIDFSDGSLAPTSPLSPKFNMTSSSHSSDTFVSHSARNPFSARNLQTSFSIGAENSNSSSSRSSQVPSWAKELRPYLNKGSTGFKI